MIVARLYDYMEFPAVGMTSLELGADGARPLSKLESSCTIIGFGVYCELETLSTPGTPCAGLAFL